MTVITRTVEIPKGSMRIRIGQLNNCSIGLIAVGFPVTTKTIDVTCPQIDSNMFNRKRLLRRILFGSVNKNAKYGIGTIYQEFIHIIYENLDSRDKYISSFSMKMGIYSPHQIKLPLCYQLNNKYTGFKN